MWYIYVCIYNEVLPKKNNNFMIFAGKWMKLETIILNKINQSGKNLRVNVFSAIQKLIHNKGRGVIKKKNRRSVG